MRKPLRAIHILALSWSAFWIVVWIATFLHLPHEWLGIIVWALFWCGVPFLIGMMRLKVYRVRERGGADALYRKRLKYSADRQ